MKQEWEALAAELLRLFLPDRKHGCLCEDCLREEIAKLATKA